MIQHRIPEALAAMSARAFLQKYTGVSLNLWRKIKQSESFRLNGVLVNPALTEVHPGDVISYELIEHSRLEPMALPLDIRYEDDALLIVNKPAGQLVHPSQKGHTATLANAVLFYYKETQQPWSFHPVHRLDRQTSGLVLIAKQPQMQHLLSTKNGLLFHRSYLALIEGRLTPPAGQIDAPIARKPGSIIERMVSPAGSPALTYYRTIAADERYSLLELTLATGRTHQIRVHLASLGHPLLGDDLYGGTQELIARQALHSWKIECKHPSNNRNISVNAELPDDMHSISTHLNKIPL